MAVRAIVWAVGWLCVHYSGAEMSSADYGKGPIASRPFLSKPLSVIESNVELAILSPVPMSGGYEGGWTMRIGALVGQDIINSQQKILPGYFLNDTFWDDKCSPDYGTQLMLRQWYMDKKWVAMGANGCSAVCMACATVTPKIRLPQISYGCASGALSNTVRFPMMTRMMVVENSMADVFLALGGPDNWKWKEIHIITGDPLRFDAPAKHNMAFFRDKPGGIGALWLTPRNPPWEDCKELMGRVKVSQQRVLNVLGYEPFFRRSICAGVFMGMPKGAVWMSVGWHKSGWWNDFDPLMMDPKTGDWPTCDQTMVGTYYDGGLGATGLGKPAESAMDQPCDCYEGWTPRQIRDKTAIHFASGYPIGKHMLPGEPYWGIMANGLDGICVWAYALRNMLFTLKYPLDQLKRPAQKPYEEIIHFIKKELVFKGAMGTVDFKGNDLPGILAVYQIQRATLGDSTSALIKLLVATVDLLGVLAAVPGTKYMWGDGETAPGSLFKQCAPGSSLNSDGNCDLCTPGKYHDCKAGADGCTGTKNCVDCPAAFYSSKTGGVDLLSCSPCAPGKFNPDLGRTSCTDCSVGRVANSLGLTACSDCLPGEFSTLPGSSGCDRCAAGAYSSTKAQTECDVCPPGKETEGLGARALDECICITGTYLTTSQSCKPCPKMMICKTLAAEANFFTDKPFPEIEAGYWSSEDKPLSVFLCQKKRDCPGGPPASCNRGLAGHACGRCPDKFELNTNGVCEPCGDDGIGRAAIGCCLMVFLTFALGFVHMFVNWPPVLLQRTNMMGIFIGGMAVTSLLILNIYATLDSIWTPPLSSFFDAVKIFKFDLQAVSFSCIMGTDSRVGKYVFKLLSMPIASCMLVMALLVLHIFPCFRPYTSINMTSFINSAGLLVSIFFISICAISLEGFNCSENPNGMQSLASDRSIVCWEGSEHVSYVVLSIIAILAYPILFLTVTGFITYYYDKWSLSMGVKFVLRARFLVARMKPDQYFFGFYYNIRNFILALLPVMLIGQLGVQVLGLMLTFVCWLLLQSHWQPWRFPILNYFDAFSSCMNILLLTCFAMLDASADAFMVGWFIIVIFLIGLTVMTVGAIWKLTARFRRVKEFGMFLCHAKAGAGLYIRQCKCIFQNLCDREIFLDLDNLTNLDNLSFTVRAHTDNLLIVITKETYTRFWCGVEVVSAYSNKVLITFARVNDVPCSDFLSEEFLSNVDKIWGPPEQAEMEKLGISLKEVETSYRWSAENAPTYDLFFVATYEEQLTMHETVCKALKNCPIKKKAYAAELGQGCCIIYDPKSNDQACCARVMHILLIRSKWSAQLCDDLYHIFLRKVIGSSKDHPMNITLSQGGDNKTKSDTAAVALAFMSKNLIKNPISVGFLACMAAKGIPLVTVLSQEDFPVMDKPWVAQLAQGTAFSAQDLSIMRMIAASGTGQAPTNKQVAIAIAKIHKILSWRINPTESETVLGVELGRILDRMRLAKLAPGAPAQKPSWELGPDGAGGDDAIAALNKEADEVTGANNAAAAVQAEECPDIDMEHGADTGVSMEKITPTSAKKAIMPAN